MIFIPASTEEHVDPQSDLVKSEFVLVVENVLTLVVDIKHKTPVWAEDQHVWLTD